MRAEGEFSCILLNKFVKAIHAGFYTLSVFLVVVVYLFIYKHYLYRNSSSA